MIEVLEWTCAVNNIKLKRSYARRKKVTERKTYKITISTYEFCPDDTEMLIIPFAIDVSERNELSWFLSFNPSKRKNQERRTRNKLSAFYPTSCQRANLLNSPATTFLLLEYVVSHQVRSVPKTIRPKFHSFTTERRKRIIKRSIYTYARVWSAYALHSELYFSQFKSASDPGRIELTNDSTLIFKYKCVVQFKLVVIFQLRQKS